MDKPTLEVHMKLTVLLLVAASLALSSCVSAKPSQPRRLGAAPTSDPQESTPFQAEVLEWIAIGNRVRATGDTPPPLNEREAAWRTWQQLWGKTMFNLIDGGMRDPKQIIPKVIEGSQAEERAFIDACVQHGYELTEVMGYIDFAKSLLPDQVYTLVQQYIRSGAPKKVGA